MHGGVFICHASADAAMALHVVAALEGSGVPCWIAPRDIDPGESYTQAILDALDASPAVVLVFSSATNESPHVTRELETTVGAGHRIVPVRIEAVEPSRSLRYFIGTSQWLDATGPAEDWTPALVRAVRRAADRADTQPVQQVQPVAPAQPAWQAPAVAPVASAPAEPAPAAAGAGGASSGRRNAVVGAGVVAAVVVAVVATLALTGGDDPTSTAEDQSPTQQQNGGTAPASTQASRTAATGPVTCWDHSEAASSLECPVPVGRDAMTTVFPGLAATCTQKDSPIEGKAEVYECVHDGFLVRYTRWDVGFEKEKYYTVENAVPSEPWEVGGELAGLQWFSVENDPEEEDPYQWSAAYAGLPFSVSVEGETQADRSAGLTELELLPPSQVGLAPSG